MASFTLKSTFWVLKYIVYHITLSRTFGAACFPIKCEHSWSLLLSCWKCVSAKSSKVDSSGPSCLLSNWNFSPVKGRDEEEGGQTKVHIKEKQPSVSAGSKQLLQEMQDVWRKTDEMKGDRKQTPSFSSPPAREEVDQKTAVMSACLQMPAPLSSPCLLHPLSPPFCHDPGDPLLVFFFF